MKFSATKTKSGKIHSGTFGNVTVTIYERRRKLVRKYKRQGHRKIFEVADYTTGRRRFSTFPTFGDAKAEAERIAKLLASGEVTAATIRHTDAASFGRMRENLRGIKTPIEMVASTYAKMYEILGGDADFIDAAKDYRRRHHAKRQARTVRQVADEVIQHAQKRKKSARYLEDLKGRLGRFAKSFAMDIASVTTAEVQTWLDKIKGAARSIKNYRDTANTLFNYAEARGYITRGENPVTWTQKVEDCKDEEITTYTPTELQRLITAAPESFKPVIALQAFAGLRAAEVMRLHWRDVKFSIGHIDIPANKTKTASRRIVPIAPNLAQWLAPYALKKGKVFRHKRSYFHEIQTSTAAATGRKADSAKQIAAIEPVAWKHNALRHSYISYRLAEVLDVPRVALESGNSPPMIFRHYRAIKTPDDAKAWFAIAPDTSDKIVPLSSVSVQNSR